jgi:PAS domain-containing protein
MNESAENNEELIIKDFDLIYVISFDIGARINIMDLWLEYAKASQDFNNALLNVKAFWYPPLGIPIPLSKIEEGKPSKLPSYLKKLLRDKTFLNYINKAVEETENELIKELIERLKREAPLFMELYGVDGTVLNPEYLELGRYIRLKLVDFEAEVDDSRFKDLGTKVGKFRVEPYLLIHETGVGVVTLWINMKGEFTVDDVIKLSKYLINNINLRVTDPLGNQQESTLLDFIEAVIITPLQIMTLFKGYNEIVRSLIRASKVMIFEKDETLRESKVNEILRELPKSKESKKELKKVLREINNDPRKFIEENLRTSYASLHVIIGIREPECGDGCLTAEDIARRHMKEIAGILAGNEHWRNYTAETAKEYLEENLSSSKSYAIYLTRFATLFLGSQKMKEEIYGELKLNSDNKDIGFRIYELTTVVPVEFLALSWQILNSYISLCRKRREEVLRRIKGGGKRGEVVKPSELVSLRGELLHALEEYNNVLLFKSDPFMKVIEYGKKRWNLSKVVDELKSELNELSVLAGTYYEEAILRRQLILTIIFGIFGLFAELDVLTKFVGKIWAMVLTAITAVILYLIYRWYIKK